MKDSGPLGFTFRVLVIDLHMATIVNNPGSDSGSGAAGWVVAAIVSIGLLLFAVFVWPGFGGVAGGGGGTNINVEVPSPTGGAGGGAGS